MELGGPRGASLPPTLGCQRNPTECQDCLRGSGAVSPPPRHLNTADLGSPGLRGERGPGAHKEVRDIEYRGNIESDQEPSSHYLPRPRGTAWSPEKAGALAKGVSPTPPQPLLSPYGTQTRRTRRSPACLAQVPEEAVTAALAALLPRRRNGNLEGSAGQRAPQVPAREEEGVAGRGEGGPMRPLPPWPAAAALSSPRPRAGPHVA